MCLLYRDPLNPSGSNRTKKIVPFRSAFFHNCSAGGGGFGSGIMCERYVVHNDCYRSTFYYIWPASCKKLSFFSNMASGLRIHGSLHHAAAREWQEPHIHASSLIYPIFVTSKPKGAQLQAGDVRPATAHTPSHSLTTSKQMLCACNLS